MLTSNIEDLAPDWIVRRTKTKRTSKILETIDEFVFRVVNQLLDNDDRLSKCVYIHPPNHLYLFETPVISAINWVTYMLLFNRHGC